MNLLHALTTFAVVFLAELPDKSMLASLVLGTRLPPLRVWAGVAAAFLAHVAIAVTAGQALTLLPGWVVQVVVAALFTAGGAFLLLSRDRAETAEAGAAPPAAARARGGRAALAAFGVVFMGEWGDITQLTTANLAARYGDPLSVGVGALLALWTVAALAIVAGQGLLRLIPVRLVRRLAGLAFLTLAALTLVDLARG